MKCRPGIGFILALVVLACAPYLAFSQQTAKPLAEQELIFLLGKNVSSRALADMVKSYGVTFELDPQVLDRLKKAGAGDVLLEAVRRTAKPPSSAVEAAKPVAVIPTPEAVPPLAQQHLEAGLRKLKENDYGGALHEFADADKVRPDWGPVLYHRGLALAALGHYAEAAAEWKKYLSSAPSGTDEEPIQQKIAAWENEVVRIEKTRALLVAGDQQVQRRDPRAAAQSFREALALDDSVGPLLALARLELLAGDYKLLAETAQKTLALDPQSALAKLYLADAELRQGEIEKCLTALQQGLTFNPYLAYGRALMGQALEHKTPPSGGQQKPAREGGANAASAEERNRLGWVLWNGGHFQEALDELDKAALLDPEEGRWQCDLAYARIAQRDTAGALAAAREAVRLNPASPCGHHTLALAMERSGQHDQASLEYQQALKLISIPNAESLLRPPMHAMEADVSHRATEKH
ncbi:MAG: tetratricopeptide repeat protein [Acidobacteriia bacterium]|nr:tetratricopeptide repeat protein [Terriglobia bacterium]